jgi:hypothetical protein
LDFFFGVLFFLAAPAVFFFGALFFGVADFCAAPPELDDLASGALASGSVFCSSSLVFVDFFFQNFGTLGSLTAIAIVSGPEEGQVLFSRCFMADQVPLTLSSLVALAPVLLQAAEDQQEEALAEAIVFFILLAVFGLAAGALAIGMYRDARRRGQGGAVWATAWAAPGAIVVFLVTLGILAGSAVFTAVLSIFVIIVGGLVILIAWVASRSPTILYDRKGNPVHPGAVLRSDPSLVPGEPPPSRAMSAAGGYPLSPWLSHARAPPPQYTAYVPPAPAPPVGQRAQVRCPNCQTVFEYAKNPWGASRVECPACRLSGTI